CRSHEIVLGDLEPNLDHARSLFPSNMRDVISQASLKPRFCTKFSRISHQCANNLCTTRTSFDEGYIVATERSEPISEVEFKLRYGSLRSFTNECVSFLNQTSAALLMESKAERGYRLASGELPHPVKAPDIGVPCALPLPEAIIRILRHSFHHFLDNHPAVTLSGGPASIHQMRVAIRRLRSTIRVFTPVLCLDAAIGL